jgi:Tol biopolymer transport system component
MIEPYKGARVWRNRWRMGAVMATSALAVYLPSSPAGAGSPGATERVSIATNGVQGTGGSISSPSISDDGQVVAYHSRAEKLVPNDTNNREDVFVRDRNADTTLRVSVSSSGEQGEGPSLAPEISGNGRVIVFGSGAPNLVPNDTNADPPAPTASAEAIGRDVFVHDLNTKVTERVSVGSDESEGRCFEPGTNFQEFRFCGGGVALAEADINFDGRFVAFAGNGENLVSNDTNGATDVFVRDRLNGTTTRVSVSTAGAQGNGASSEPSISDDGRYVAFSSAATNLVAGDTNNQRDVFVRDTVANTTTRVSVVTGGGQGCAPVAPATTCSATSGAGASTSPTISDDGNVVAFASGASILVPGDTNNANDVFVHVRNTNTTSRVSGGLNGAELDGAFFPHMSGNGRFVAFDSLATNVVAGDTNALSDVFVHDRQAGFTSRVSVTRSLGQSNGASYFPALNQDGRFVTFASDASNLVPGDNNFTSDVFVHDRTQPTPRSTGYRLVASDGGVFAFGDAPFLGSTGAIRLASPIVGTAALPDGSGYWMVAADGGVFAFGKAGFYGSAAGRTLAKPIVAMAATPTGAGYWLVGGDGAVFPFGDARSFGSTAAIRLAQPIVGIAPSFSGLGYWLVAADGGVFGFGDAIFRGSTGAIRLAQPIVGMAATPSGGGYYLVASDGGVFAFGNAVFRGSMGATRLNQPVVGISANPSGGGYWMVARDGGIFAFGDAGFYGSTGAIRLNLPIVAVAAAG